MITPMFELLAQLESDSKHILGYILVELIAVKIDKIAEYGNTGSYNMTFNQTNEKIGPTRLRVNYKNNICESTFE